MSSPLNVLLTTNDIPAIAFATCWPILDVLFDDSLLVPPPSRLVPPIIKSPLLNCIGSWPGLKIKSSALKLIRSKIKDELNSNYE